jgi:hypothetical protein
MLVWGGYKKDKDEEMNCRIRKVIDAVLETEVVTKKPDPKAGVDFYFIYEMYDANMLQQVTFK